MGALRPAQKRSMDVAPMVSRPANKIRRTGIFAVVFCLGLIILPGAHATGSEHSGPSKQKKRNRRATMPHLPQAKAHNKGKATRTSTSTTGRRLSTYTRKPRIVNDSDRMSAYRTTK